jgi:hypothetical protein
LNFSVTISLSVFQAVRPAVCLSVLSLWFYVCLSVFLYVFFCSSLFVLLSVCLSFTSLSLILSLSLFVCLSVFQISLLDSLSLLLYLCVCLPMFPSVCLSVHSLSLFLIPCLSVLFTEKPCMSPKSWQVSTKWLFEFAQMIFD